MACFASAVERQGLSAVDGSIEAIAQLFLQHGLVEPVHQLLSHAQNSGRRADQARLRFWLARYALETKNWTQAQRHKAQITNRYSLSADQQDYLDRKSTRLNSSHVAISYAVFCLKKKKKI